MTLLRMLAFRPAEAGSGGTVAIAKPIVSGTGKTSVDSAKGAQPAKQTATSSGNDAAKAARAAFDDMHKQEPENTAKSPEIEFKSEPELTFEVEPESRPEPEPETETETETKPALKVEHEVVAKPASGEAEPDWSRLQANLNLTGAVRELARNLQLESADEKCWKFLVPDTLQHLGSKSVVQSLQSALSSCLGHAVMLDLHTVAEPLKSVAAAAHSAEINRMSEAERAIDEDSTVQEIKKEFGAKIIPDSIQPLQ